MNNLGLEMPHSSGVWHFFSYVATNFLKLDYGTERCYEGLTSDDQQVF